MSNVPNISALQRIFKNWWDQFMPRKRVVKPRLWLFLMAVISLAFLISYSLQGRLLTQKEREIEELRILREEIETTTKELARKIEFTKTDTYVERIAHEELGLLRPDEIRIVEAGS